MSTTVRRRGGREERKHACSSPFEMQHGILHVRLRYWRFPKATVWSCRQRRKLSRAHSSRGSSGGEIDMQFSYSGNFVSLPWTRATAFQTEILSTELPCTNRSHGTRRTAFPTSARAWLAEYNPWGRSSTPALRDRAPGRLLVVSLSCPMEQVGRMAFSVAGLAALVYDTFKRQGCRER